MNEDPLLVPLSYCLTFVMAGGAISMAAGVALGHWLKAPVYILSNDDDQDDGPSTCTECGTEWPDGIENCPHCGIYEFSCEKCRKPLTPGRNMCSNCGHLNDED